MKEWIKDISIAVAVAIIIIQFIEPSRVYGISMLPNFEDRDYLVISKQAYSRTLPERGDVVVFETELVDENGNDKNLIKRVIGLPGEKVTVSDGKVYINGEQLDDSYTLEGYTNGMVEIVVPEGEVFCLGDNRLHSTDSRSYSVGCIPTDEIIGKVVFRLFPFSKFGLIRS